MSPFDILSGKIVKTAVGTFYFKEAGFNLKSPIGPIYSNLHRTNDLPAAEWATGLLEWYQNGVKHRTNGPAYDDGPYKEWWVNGNLHREDGPAVIGLYKLEEWFINGCRHRTDGPAYMSSTGTLEYWKYGKRTIGPNGKHIFLSTPGHVIMLSDGMLYNTDEIDKINYNVANQCA